MRVSHLLRLAVAGLLVVGCQDSGTNADAVTDNPAPPPVASSMPEPAPSPSASAAPKRASIAEALAAIPEDPAPPKIIRQTHYFVSNEPSPEKFRLHAENRGGIYLGVGAEQNYLFAGWARPEVLILADFDQWVVDVHRIHGVLMRHAKDPEAYVELWSRNKRARARELISKSVTDPEARERLLDRFRVTRSGVFMKLLNQQVGYRGRNIPTWLTDRAQYDHLAGLHRRGHARAVRGDFTGQRTLAGIARAARTIGIPVRTIYLSNVEDYFHYSSGLGRNLLAQPVDERSMLLRTLAVEGTKYRYVAQRMVDFRRWLEMPGVDHRLDIFAQTSIQHGPRGQYVGGPPDESRSAN
jgi:hypothetical protein